MNDGNLSDLARRLARNAEAVCRHYLSNGQRNGRYWLVGNVDNAPGRSLYVRLVGPDSGKGAAGKWTDAATGEHGDLLDLIAVREGLADMREAAAEARRFLNLPRSRKNAGLKMRRGRSAKISSEEAARRLFAAAHPISGTLAATYLRHRGIVEVGNLHALRFHPRCFQRNSATGCREEWPAMLASVTDSAGQITGVHRTFLARDGISKAPLETPRRAMGRLLGYCVRFGDADDIVVAGEGIETTLSVRCALPGLPSVAALSANHLAVLVLPATLRRLYVLIDEGSAGKNAADRLEARVRQHGAELFRLHPAADDFNTDLISMGPARLRDTILAQFAAPDRERFTVPDRDPSSQLRSGTLVPSSSQARAWAFSEAIKPD